MIPDLCNITSEDFPGLAVEIRRPDVAAWSDAQNMIGQGNNDEAYLNLLIARGRIVCADGTPPPAHFGELCDDWPGLPELAFGQFALMAGTFSPDKLAAETLDLPAMIAAVEGVKLTPEETALADLADRCTKLGLDVETMRTIVACNPRLGSYRAILLTEAEAVLVLRRPRFPAWSSYNRERRGGRIQEASTRLVTACCEFPGAAGAAALIEKLPAVAPSAAAVCMAMVADQRSEVGKGSAAFGKPPATPSTPLPA
jgi:hypothetical protein